MTNPAESDARAELRERARNDPALRAVLAELDRRDTADTLAAAEAEVRTAVRDPRLGKALRVVLAEYDRRGGVEPAPVPTTAPVGDPPTPAQPALAPAAEPPAQTGPTT